MSKPRQVLPGQFYLLTRRCAQRLFLLRPDAATNNAFIYCLAVAALRCEVDVLLTVAESNHHHTGEPPNRSTLESSGLSRTRASTEIRLLAGVRRHTDIVSDWRTSRELTVNDFAARCSARCLLWWVAMSKPRQVLPGQFYLLTRRCTQRLFLMRPDAATNNGFIYCLALAALRCEVDVLLTVAESNHHHTVIFDRYGRVSEFAEYFHRLMARSQNALRGRWENFWSSQEPCITRLLDRETVIAKLTYTAANPVKDGLVERVHHWPGVNTYSNFRSGRELQAKRPRHFFRNPGPMPESVALKLSLPPELGPADEVIAEVVAAVGVIEKREAAERARTGARVMGRRAILDQAWDTSPKSEEPRRNLRPRFAGRRDLRMDAVAAYRCFLDAYRCARAEWLRGVRAMFPIGTYWLSRFAAVPIATPGIG